MKELEPTEHTTRGLLDGAISMAFETCSIAAAEANDTAYKLAKHLDVEQQVYTLEDPLSPQEINLRRLGFFLNESTPVELALARPYVERAHTVATPKGSRGFLRREVIIEEEEVIKKELDVPHVVAMIGEDIMLPLARFERKTESEDCSYVLLGGEIHDESVFSTLLDEQTSRLDMIEALRFILDKHKLALNNHYYHLPKDWPIDSLSSLMATETKRYESQLPGAMEAQLARLCCQRIEQAKTMTEMFILTQDGEIMREVNFKAAEILPDTVLGDGRKVSLVLGSDQSRNLQLYAQTRNKLLMPLVKILPETGQCIIEEQDELAHSKNTLIESLLEAMRGQEERNNPEKLHEHLAEYAKQYENDLGYYGRAHIGHIVRYGVTEVARQSGNPKLAEDIIGAVYEDEDIEGNFSEIRKVYTYSELLENKYSNQKSFRQFMELADMLTEPRKEFFKHFNVADRLNQKLGETSKAEEQYLELLLEKYAQGSKHRGKFKNPVGKIEATMDIEAQLEQNGTEIKLVLHGRPAKMTNEQRRLLLALPFNLAHGVMGRRKGGSDISLDDLRELSDTLNKLKPVGSNNQK